MSGLTRDATAGPVSRDRILRRERGQGKIHFPRSADHEQDWQPYPVDPSRSEGNSRDVSRVTLADSNKNSTWGQRLDVILYTYN